MVKCFVSFVHGVWGSPWAVHYVCNPVPVAATSGSSMRRIRSSSRLPSVKLLRVFEKSQCSLSVCDAPSALAHISDRDDGKRRKVGTGPQEQLREVYEEQRRRLDDSFREVKIA